MDLNNRNRNNEIQENEYTQSEDFGRDANHLSDDVFLPPEIRDQIPQSFTRKRTKKKKPPVIGVVAVVFVTLVVIFSLYWTSTHRENQSHQMQGDNEAMSQLPPNFPPPGRSAVQDELIEVNWVDQDFLPVNPYSRPGIILDSINGIVIHNIGNPNTTAQQNRNFFANLAQTQERHASAHFIICLDGRILQCVPVDEMAYASNQRNIDTLAIELCHPDDTGAFTEETYAAAVFLTAWLCVQFNLTVDDVIRHSDVVATDCPRYFTNNEDAWEAFKNAVASTIARIQADNN